MAADLLEAQLSLGNDVRGREKSIAGVLADDL